MPFNGLLAGTGFKIRSVQVPRFRGSGVSGFGVWGLGMFRVRGLGFRGLEFRVRGLGFRVVGMLSGSKFRGSGVLGLEVDGKGFRAFKV